MYKKELEVLEKKGRLRQRKIYDNVIDLASNDYLCLAENKNIRKKAFDKALNLHSHGAKASMLVNGYTQIHKDFEEYLCKLNGFEEGIVLGSGFLANLALFELVRKKDLALIDEEYHASGILGSKTTQGEIRFFKHNDLEDLIKKSGDYKNFNRVFVFTEGVFSMRGDKVKKEITTYAQEIGTLVIDEAHSVGICGDKLLGITEEYNLNPSKTIKMGTLGKALGSYGAYILADKEICNFLINRAKSIIYTTALSPVDILLAKYALEEIQNNPDFYKQQINDKISTFNTQSLIKTIEEKNIESLMKKQKELQKRNILIGAIRPPTVKTPIFRIILRTCIKNDIIEKTINFLESE